MKLNHTRSIPRGSKVSIRFHRYPLHIINVRTLNRHLEPRDTFGTFTIGSTYIGLDYEPPCHEWCETCYVTDDEENVWEVNLEEGFFTIVEVL